MSILFRRARAFRNAVVEILQIPAELFKGKSQSKQTADAFRG
jgi:hypothetical protein